ncbi:nuclear transport factor 2 family protein [Dinoroseobacter sp. S76]|uniref:nuclear transport factor 2 family protein n=1 Tax=Dinoroseobacter sp. S76 TaxID=3415124 RepID=UPI003C7BF16A
MIPLPDIVAEYIAAYNARNVKGMLACLSDEIAFSHLEDGIAVTESVGKPAFAELAVLGAQAFEMRHQRVTQATTTGPITRVELVFTGRVATDLPNGWTAGQEVRVRGSSEFHLRDGRIVRLVDETLSVEA